MKLILYINFRIFSIKVYESLIKLILKDKLYIQNYNIAKSSAIQFGLICHLTVVYIKFKC